MDRVVHGTKHNAGRGLGDVGMPAVQQDRNVVVPVQENEFLFVNDDEKGVYELGKLRQDKQLYPQSSRSTAVV